MKKMINETDTIIYKGFAPEKVSRAMTRLARRSENGGNPFVFMFAISMEHIINNNIKTAATDGKKYYWNESFIEGLSDDTVGLVVCHEVYHVVLYHCSRLKMNHTSNIAVDYAANAIIALQHKNSGKNLWSEFHILRLDQLLDYIDGNSELPDTDKKIIYVDDREEVLKMTAEEIYDLIKDHMDKSPRKCKDCEALSIDPKTGESRCKDDIGKPGHCPTCGASPSEDGDGEGEGGGEDEGDEGDKGEKEGKGKGKKGKGNSDYKKLPGTLDDHKKLPEKGSIGDLQERIEKALEGARAIGDGSLDTLEKLIGMTKPVMSLKDHIRLIKMKSIGKHKSWRKFQRRPITWGEYKPVLRSKVPTYLAMLDTSGSMSKDDFVWGVSQLKSLGTLADGLIVPCDTEPKWAHVTKINKSSDLSSTKIAGGGGTAFEEFLTDFPKKVGIKFDVIIMITDGYVDYGEMKRPRIPVLWLITARNHEPPIPFGKLLMRRG